MRFGNAFRQFKPECDQRMRGFFRHAVSSPRTAPVVIFFMSLMIIAGYTGAAVTSASARSENVTSAAVYTPPIKAPAPDRPVSVAFIGDSYTVGTGTSQKFNRWSTSLSEKRNWLELNYGVSATNFSTGSRERLGRPYADRLTDLIVSNPDIVIVSSAGINLSSDQRPGIKKTFLRLREGLPHAKIVAISPFYWNEEFPKRHAVFGNEIENMVESVGGEYLDIGHPLGENHPSLLADDGTHPSDAGHRAIAEEVDAALVRVLD